MGDVPERYWRFSTREAINSLAARLGLPTGPDMQDWEIMVADASRLTEFLAALEGGDLTADEQFTLAQVVMQCFEQTCVEMEEDGDGRPDAPEGWERFVVVLRARPELHAYTLAYWASYESELADAFCMTRFVRPLWEELRPVVDASAAPR
jgi:hypothetical protein